MALSKSSRDSNTGADLRYSRAELLSVLRWFLAAWAVAGLALASWFAIPYVAAPENPFRHELLMGFFIGVAISLPPAIAQPFLVAYSWRTLPRSVRAFQLLPAALLFLVVALVSSGGPF